MTTSQLLERLSGDEICPDCEEEITISAPSMDQVELECRCGCSLAVA